MSGSNTSITVITKKVGGISVVSLVQPGISLTPVVRGLQGPMGPIGLTGPAGTSSNLQYVHHQATASSVWAITHNLGKYPNVFVLDSAGDECDGAIFHASLNDVVLTFSAAFSGTANLS